MDFEAFMDEAWSDHAEHAALVAVRFVDSTFIIQETAQIQPFAQLAAHVFGEHLGQWANGIAFLRALTELPCFAPDTEAEATIQRLTAALSLAGGVLDPSLPTLPLSDRVRVLALAVSALTGQGETARAAELFEHALELASQIEDADPAHRALAVTGNNLAADLEEKKERTPAERDLMLLAARSARKHWALAGTWLNVERAEYRLARSCLAAGELEAAWGHACACLAISREHGAEARELFWGFEGLARVEHARQDASAFQQAIVDATALLPDLPDAFRAACEGALEKLVHRM